MIDVIFGHHIEKMRANLPGPLQTPCCEQSFGHFAVAT
jgi:hypothetical protein